MRRSRRQACVGVGLVFLLLATPAAASHDKTDIVKVDDGGVYVGEIKSVQYATLNLNTDPAGLLSIEWRHVTGLTSKFEYRVELSGGVRHFGSLGPAKAARAPEHRRLVRPDRGRPRGRRRDRADRARVLEAPGRLGEFRPHLHPGQRLAPVQPERRRHYRTRKNFATLSGQSIFSTQDGGETTNQHYVTAGPGPARQEASGARSSWVNLRPIPTRGTTCATIVGGGATNFVHRELQKALDAEPGCRLQPRERDGQLRSGGERRGAGRCRFPTLQARLSFAQRDN